MTDQSEQQLCIKFLSNLTINPWTGHTIQKGAGIHRQLINRCGKYFQLFNQTTSKQFN